MTPKAFERRRRLVGELHQPDGDFGAAAARILDRLRAELATAGPVAVLDHLRLCGAMPEHFAHDSSEEKLYAKYTDAVVCVALEAMGLRSALIAGRGDAADVQARGADYTLVADAKAFRLSRTAKNQKDFKVQALAGWRAGADRAMLVCPIYHLPGRTSQIYRQAITHNVCLLSYAHLAALVALARTAGAAEAEAGLRQVLWSVELLPPGKSAVDYWHGVNQALVSALGAHADLWRIEKVASWEALEAAKAECLRHLRAWRDHLLGLSHQEALAELLRLARVDARLAEVESLRHGDLLGA
jgi:type II restriction enzyme